MSARLTPEARAACERIGADPDAVAENIAAHLRTAPTCEEYRVAERPQERRLSDPAPVYLRTIALRLRRVEGVGWVWAPAADGAP